MQSNEDGIQSLSDSKHAEMIEEVQGEKGRSHHHLEAVDDTFVPAEEDGNFPMTWSNLLACAAISLGWIADIFELSMVSTILATINAELGPSTSYTWIAASQTVAVACLSPLAGRFGDIFGRRNFLLFGSVCGMIGCIICGTGQSINTLIGGGAIIGVGSACHQSGWTCVGELVPKKSRGLALGLLETSFAPASLFAGLAATAFVQNGYWRPVFWLPLGINFLAFALVFFFYHPKNQYIREEGRTTWNQLMDTDFVGVLLSVAGLVLFLLGISFGGSKYPWKSAGTIAPIIIGVATLAVLVVYEAKANLKYPMFPPVLFNDVRGFTLVIIAIFVAGMIYYSSLVIFPSQVGVLYTQDPIKIGAYTMVLGSGSFAAPVFGWAMKRFNKAHIILPVSLAFLTLFSGLQAIVSPQSAVGSTIICGLAICFVAGISVLTTAVIQIVVKHEYMGVATGIAVSVRNLGGSVGTTIYVAILQQTLQSNLVKDVATPLALAGVAPTSIGGVLEALLGGDRTSPLLAALTPGQLALAASGITQSYVGAFKTVYLVSIAFGVITTVLICFMANVDKLMTATIDIKLEEGAHIHTHDEAGLGHVIHFVEK